MEPVFLGLRLLLAKGSLGSVRAFELTWTFVVFLLLRCHRALGARSRSLMYRAFASVSAVLS